jgi:uncharacterized membrane protein
MKIDLSTPNTLAGLGIVLSITPYVGIAGPIVLLIAFYQYSKALSDDEIFKKYLTAFLLSLFGGIGIVFLIYLGFYLYITEEEIGIGLILLALMAYGLIVLCSYMYKQSFSLIASKLGHKRIETAGKYLFIGSLLAIILVGFLISFIGWILAAIGFFTAPKEID